MKKSQSKLYIVATPIGNLSDITFRAIEILKNVSLIAAEDTRHTRELLNHFEIDTKTISYHEYSEDDKIEEIISILKDGKDVAIVTDAGTPIISDPGNSLVKRAIEEDIEVTGVPGACAAVNALTLSGIDASSFVFVGFIPEDNKKRSNLLTDLSNETRTMIFYISPHNILKDLKSLIKCFGEDRYASISREMTKIYEETVRGQLSYLLEYFSNKEVKGEFVLVLRGLDKSILDEEKMQKFLDMDLDTHMKIYTDKGISEKEAMKFVAKDRGVNKNDIYKKLKVKD